MFWIWGWEGISVTVLISVEDSLRQMEDQRLRREDNILSLSRLRPQQSCSNKEGKWRSKVQTYGFWDFWGKENLCKFLKKRALMEATFSNWGPHGHLYPPPLWYEEEAEKTTEKSPHIIRSDSLGLKESRNSANRSKATATYHRLAVTVYTCWGSNLKLWQVGNLAWLKGA